MRAYSTATDEHHHCFLVDLRAQLGEESLVRVTAGIGLPLDFHTAGNPTNVVELRARAHIDQPGSGLLHQRVRLLREQLSLVSQAFLAGTLVRARENLRNQRRHWFTSLVVSGQRPQQTVPVYS
jgi:hypothetical protein